MKWENLDDLNVGWLGVFIAPTTKLAVWWGCLPHGAPDIPVHTGHVRCASHVTKAVGFRPLELCLLGPPGCPVNYSGAPLDFPEGEEFIVKSPGAPDTVRWHTGQSGAPDQGYFGYPLLSLLNPILGLFIG
jgi:hypothetical protein